MEISDFRLTVLGTRGSMATGGADVQVFGGSTSCYMVQAGKETIFLDAGSGLLSAPSAFPAPPVILLSHLHLDHLIGLGMFPVLSRRGEQASLYVPFCRSGREAGALLDRVFTPPFWPLRLRELEATLRIHTFPERMQIGEVQVESIPGHHPDGCMVLKLSYRGRSLVYATDYEHEQSHDEALAAFAKGTDLLLYDAQFSSEDYPRKKGFGHSTAEKGLELMERAQARRLLLIHHDPHSTDLILRQREAALGTDRASYAREGETIEL